jgi:beta-1,4-mannosyl-glycoprotein beta-1,4-N-acetylglucosaminyltransferase
MIVDTFMFGLEYELDLLEIRLNYLNPIVDFFVLVEAEFTQTGHRKELFFENNKERYKTFLHKIIPIKLDTPKKIYNSWEQDTTTWWENENYQRNSISIGLSRLNLNNDDIIIVSDLDEIPSINSIQIYKNKNLIGQISLQQEMYYYYLNLKASYYWRGSQLLRYGNIVDGNIQKTRDARNLCPILTEGGWHFSYIGGPKAILNKINSVCETSLHDDYKDIEVINNFMYTNTLHFNNSKLEIVPVPQFIDIEKYKHIMKF